jgi:hypothetical protein
MNTEKANIKASMGGYGVTVTSTAGTYTGIYCCIEALTECVVTAEGVNVEGITSLTLPENRSIVGDFTSITLTSGTLIMYKGV